MKPAQDIRVLCERGTVKLKRMSAASRAFLESGAVDQDLAVAAAIIELQNFWATFLRALFLSCATGARDKHGTRIDNASQVDSVDGAVDFAMRTLLPRRTGGPPWPLRREPAWHRGENLLAVADAMGLSVRNDIAEALSVPTIGLNDLPAFRNFYAHRNRETFMTVMDLRRKYGLLGVAHPTDFLLATPMSSMRPLLIEMYWDMRNVIGQLQ